MDPFERLLVRLLVAQAQRRGHLVYVDGPAITFVSMPDSTSYLRIEPGPPVRCFAQFGPTDLDGAAELVGAL
jgi:hypothetical protein